MTDSFLIDSPKLSIQDLPNPLDLSGIFSLAGHQHTHILRADPEPPAELGLVHNAFDFLKPFRHLFAPVSGLKQRKEDTQSDTSCQVENRHLTILQKGPSRLKTIGERMRAWGEAKFGSVKAFAEAMEMVPPALQGYLSGRREPGTPVLQRLAALGADIEWILTGVKNDKVRDDATPYETMKGWAPFLGRILASPDGKEYFDDAGIPKGAGVPFFNDNSFTLEIDGDSLLNADPIPIMPGDICVFESGRQPKNGDIVAVHLVDQRRMVKILRHLSKDEVELKSANKYRNYPAIKLKKKQIASYGIFVTKLQLTDDAKQRFGLMRKGGK